MKCGGDEAGHTAKCRAHAEYTDHRRRARGNLIPAAASAMVWWRVWMLVVVDVTFHEIEDVEEPVTGQLACLLDLDSVIHVRHLSEAEGQGDEEAGEEDSVLDMEDAA